jgi:site-specific recombinase XerC
MVSEWKALLLDYPVKAAEISAFKGMTMCQVVEPNVKIGKPRITNRTVNRYLTALGAFRDRLVRNDYLDVNPVAGLLQTIDKKKRSTLPITVEQMEHAVRLAAVRRLP